MNNYYQRSAASLELHFFSLITIYIFLSMLKKVFFRCWDRTANIKNDMKRIFLMLSVLLACVNMFGASTTYTFTSLKWNSSIGVIKCDGKTDGWVSLLDASEYVEGRLDAQKRLYSQGVGVKKATTGAGAVSVIEFEKVRKVIFNYCQNSSKGVAVWKRVVYFK